MDRIPLEAGFSAPVHSGTGEHPATRTVGTGSLLGIKWPGRGVDHQPPLTPRIKKEYSYTTTPPPLYLHGRLRSELHVYKHNSITMNRILKHFVAKEDANKIIYIINPRFLPKLPPKLRLPLFVQLATPSSASLPSMRNTMRDRNAAGVYLCLGSLDNTLSDDAII
jgi:hypothetical protein